MFPTPQNQQSYYQGQGNARYNGFSQYKTTFFVKRRQRYSAEWFSNEFETVSNEAVVN